jgi:signal transduction histidine kinase
MPSAFLERLRPALSFRFVLWYAAVFVASSLGLFTLTYQLLERSLRNGDRELVSSTLTEYASGYQAGGLPALRLALAARQRTGADADLFVRSVGPDRETVFLSLPHGWAELASAPASPPTAAAGILEWTALRGDSRGLALEIASLWLPDGALFQVGRSSRARVQVLARFREVLGVVFALVLLVGLGGGAVFTRSALRPLRDLNQVVRGIIETGRLSARVPVRGSGEPLDALAALVNAMLARIESLVQAMRGSLDAVAHDLRTPLTRLHVVLESALQDQRPEKERDALADALEETERVADTLNVVMDVSEAEAGVMRLDLQPVPLCEVLADVVELYADSAEDKRIALSWSCAQDLAVRADRRRLRQVFANLIDNAVKYTPTGGEIAVEGRREGEEAVVDVSDSGRGVAVTERERIWERLYRGDASRSERGLGLGLSLVRAIVQAHHGQTSVADGPAGGARFSVRLPALSSVEPVSRE